MNAIDNFEEFLECDLPSMVFPKDEILGKVKGEDWYREDAFQTKEDVERYIAIHFKVFRDELAQELGLHKSGTAESNVVDEQRETFTEDLTKSGDKNHNPNFAGLQRIKSGGKEMSSAEDIDDKKSKTCSPSGDDEFEPCGCDKIGRTFCEKHYNELYDGDVI